ncbi:MAG: BON domain-containing protein [Solirubrobacterales bacterium]|nr:BON domain-containing protein [Solirubrobacterales bacterium]
MSVDTNIERDIRGALSQDPRIPAPNEVAISSVDGSVVLRGTVGSFNQRRAAVSDTRKVTGVYEVDDQLEVRLIAGSQIDDAELRGRALQVLMWDNQVPEDLINVKVSDGWVTLTGEVSYQFQSDAVFNDVANLDGVVGITNKVQVTTIAGP